MMIKKLLLSFLTLFTTQCLADLAITLRYDTANNIHSLTQHNTFSTNTRDHIKQQTIRAVLGQAAHISFEQISPFLAEIPSGYESGVYGLISSKTGFTITVTEINQNTYQAIIATEAANIDRYQRAKQYRTQSETQVTGRYNQWILLSSHQTEEEQQGYQTAPRDTHDQSVWLRVSPQ